MATSGSTDFEPNVGGFIAKGCGAVMKPRKKVTTIS